MTKQAYMKPSMKVVKIQQKCHILAGSFQYGMNNKLQDKDTDTDLVDEAW